MCFAIAASLNLASFHDSLGTVGGGNHFSELLRVERVVDPSGFASLGLSADRLFLLVHSGSRGFGGAILDRHAAAHGAAGLAFESPEAQTYIRLHDLACGWAKRNRRLIAHRFLAALNVELAETRCVLDVWHNNVVAKDYDMTSLLASDPASPTISCTCSPRLTLQMHRKGAAPADAGVVVIPGSRGAFSYLVRPVVEGEAPAHHGFSLAHGAGRKLNRSTAAQTMQRQYAAADLTETQLGSTVVCTDKSLLFEECPEAYKCIEDVIQSLQDAKLLDVLCVFRPVITYKTKV